MDYTKYVVSSLELHLFFARIMKEHSLFLEAGFTPKNTKLSKEADNYKLEFEKLLLDVVKLSDGIVGENVMSSGEIYTDYTLSTEETTQYLTWIPINQNITKMELMLHGGKNKNIKPKMVKEVKQINKRAIKLLDGLIDLKSRILNDMHVCKLFTVNYPLLIKHILREAKLYHFQIVNLDEGGDTEDISIKETELFWDQIMMEHALFIRGLLDPSENQLIETSDKFSKDYASLLENARNMTDATMASVTSATLDETIKLKDFKETGTKGVEECKIQAIFLPLLADHVLREANHYIRLLKDFETKM